ncbi:1-phosphatidylinositol 3-phosphate 5-kinase-like [Anneissia japonica]|uniref:1-phosphatidylinositol 3-phosphate 5-kinase-like n=1 Tax=Anneissia japonica TaxID=1529436 RepID=UPI0014257F40|nr:1-phosphatidylinositol 3-phosphate 5-kinase-like [Anneissia japonica]XP_033114735.1 1-phosphatidylinositol 3-phosphate 5-kinase-like [Anneissia japonica]
MASVSTPQKQRKGKTEIPGEEITWFKPLSPEETKNTGFSFLKLFRWTSSSEVSNSSSPRRGQSPVVSRGTSPLHGQSRGSSRASSRNPSPLPEAREASEVRDKDDHLNDDEGDIEDNDDDESWTEVSKQDSWKDMPTRSLTTIVSHLSKIIERRGQTPQAYRDSDFKQYWMPDSQCKECYECGDKFTTFRRRHHCRVCGQIFCSRCCNQEVPGRVMGYTGYLRVCTSCCKVVLSYAHSHDQNDLKALQEDLKSATESALLSIANLSLDTLSTKMKDDFRGRRRTYSSSSIDSSILATRNPFEVGNLTSSTESENRRHVVENERQLLLKDSIQLRDLWLLMLQQGNGIEFQGHRYRLRTYPDCIVGSQVVDWLLSTDKATDRVQAVAIGQALLDAKWIECATRNEQLFRDEYALYRPGEAARQGNFPPELAQDKTPLSNEDLMEPIWFREITDGEANDSGSLSDMERSTVLSNSGDNYQTSSLSVAHSSVSSQFRKPLGSNNSEKNATGGDISAGPWELMFHQHAVSNDSNGHQDVLHGVHELNQVTTNEPHGWLDVEDLNDENGEKMAMERLSTANFKHLVALLNQLLDSEKLPQHWSQVILPMVETISKEVKPDVRYRNDEMDIRHYVHIKKVAGGSLSDCRIINGVVCTKNVAHRKMRTAIKDPRILILESAVEHQRVEHKFSSIEPIVLQEHEYLKNYVHKIATLQPTVLVVEKSVARLAQDFLLNCDITVVLNVKPSVVERIGRFTEGDLVKTVDQASKSCLGSCHSFSIQQFKLPKDYTKTLMFFEGCPDNFGCSVILRGAHQYELTKVKKVFQFMLFAAYHSRLEMSFLMDEFAMPPEILQCHDITPTSPKHRSLCFSDSIMEGLMKVSEGEQTDGKDEIFDKPELEKDGATNVKTLDPEVDNSTQPVSNFQNAIMKIFGAGSKEKQIHISNDSGINRETEPGSKMSEDDTSFTSNPSAPDDAEATDNADAESKVNEVGSARARSSSNLGVQSYSSQVELATSHSPIDNIGQLHHFDREGVDGSSVLNPPDSRNYNSQISMEDYIAEFHQTVDSDDDGEGEQVFGRGRTTSVMEKLDFEENSENESVFSQALKETILNSSPFMKMPLPYLETASGKASKLREHFPENLYWSPKLFPQDATDGLPPFLCEVLYKSVDRSSKRWTSISVQDPHPFLTQQLTFNAAEDSTKTILADYRARGSRIQQKTAEGAQDFLDEYPLKMPMTSIAGPARPIDCFDPKHHQKITLQFSSYSCQSYNAPNYCVRPWTVTMDFYGKNDIPLGLFLERYCFRNSYKCPSEICDASMVDHVRRFVHNNAAIQILQRQLDQPIPGFKDSILSWSWCRKCKQVTPVQPLSSDTWSMSFAKYLELRFYGMDYNRRACAETCPHSLHRHHYQYFGYLNIVASFKYSTIVLREVCFPPNPIYLKCQHQMHAKYMKIVQSLVRRGNILFSEVLENLLNFKDAENSSTLAQKINNLRQQNKSDQTSFRTHIDLMQTKLEVLDQQNPDQLADMAEHLLTQPNELHNMLLDIEDSITVTKQMINETVVTWNSRLNELFHLVKADRTERSRRNRSPLILRKSSGHQVLEQNEDISSFASLTDITVPSVSPNSKPTSPSQRAKLTRASTWSNDLVSKSSTSEPKSIVKPDRLHEPIHECDDLQVGPVFSSGSLGNMSSSPASFDSPVTRAPLLHYKEAEELKEDEVTESEKSTEVIDDDTKDNENKESQEAEDEVAVDITDGVFTSNGAGKLSTSADTGRSIEKRSSVSGSGMRNVFINFLTSSSFTPLNSPFPADEHYPSPPCTVVPVIVRDQEPSTIIAYALSSEPYKIQLSEMQQKGTSRTSSPGHSNISSAESSPTTKRKLAREADGSSGSDVSKKMARLTRRTSRVLQFLRTKSTSGIPVPPTKLPDDSQLANADAVMYHVTDSDSGNRLPSESAANECDSLFTKSVERFTGNSEPSPHIEVQFADNNAKFYCRIYYAEEFRKLRAIVFPAGEETFIRSLSACMSWIARGGKSGSRFLKTKDDRFILKQMSHLEFKSFQDFGPHYFNYLTQTYEKNKPTALAVILGVFRVGFRNSLTNATLKQDLLIMENLFFDRKMSQIFDLKGSVRNRHVKISGEETGEIVLMDENLLKVMVDSPIYIRPHTKTVLARAVQNDSTFLASHFIMDYSLLVGIDDSTNELVVGIIDYIRTFTWDKKLEMFVKSVGNQGKMPTVLSPELYGTRFREAMNCYFLMVPEYWTGMGKEIQLHT